MKAIGNKTIFENMDEILDPKHTVLVNWDVQNGLVNNVFNKDEFVGNVKKLTQLSRKKSIPVKITVLIPAALSMLSTFVPINRLAVFLLRT